MARGQYNSTMAAWDVANEALCDCQPMNYETCADYMAGAATASEVCGWSDRYGVYLKRNVYWPDVPVSCHAPLAHMHAATRTLSKRTTSSRCPEPEREPLSLSLTLSLTLTLTLTLP